MSKRNSGGNLIFLIANALFWAAAMLVGAVLFKDRAWVEIMMILMIGGYFVANGFVMSRKERSHPRC